MGIEKDKQGLVEEANKPTAETVCGNIRRIREYLEKGGTPLTCITSNGEISYKVTLHNGAIFCSVGLNSFQFLPRLQKKWQRELVLTEQSLQKLVDFETESSQTKPERSVSEIALAFNRMVDGLANDRRRNEEQKKPVPAEKKQKILDDPMIQYYLNVFINALQEYQGNNSVNSGEPNKSKLHRFLLFEHDKNAGMALQNLVHYILGNKIDLYGKEAIKQREMINKQIILEIGRRMGQEWEKAINALFSNKKPDVVVSILYYNRGDAGRGYKPHSGVIYILDRI